MKKYIYLLFIVMLLVTGCNNNKSNDLNFLDKDNTSDNNDTRIDDKNSTSDNNDTRIDDKNSTSDNNETRIDDKNSTSDNNETRTDDKNSTSDNNETRTDDKNNTSDNNETRIDDKNSTGDNNETRIDDTNSTNDNNNEERRIDDKNNTSDNTKTTIATKTGKVQLGVFSKATVKLYELNKIERKLLAVELTSSGETIETIGNFNLYLEKLEDEKFYLYEVRGGEDYDVDDNGVVDDVPTLNKGVFHLLVKGRHMKAIKKATITVVSELVYQELIPSLRLEGDEIEKKMQTIAKEIIKEDINSDGFVGIEDILKYNPILDKEKLHPEYQKKIIKVIDDILNNKHFDLLAPIFINNNSTIKINENLTFVEKIEIEDGSSLTITLLGEDANNFSYNIDSQELFLLKKADFEMPHDQNSDNVFNLIIEATDNYFNSTQKDFSIEILDVDEVIPQVPILKDTNLSISENNASNTLIGTVFIENQGTESIDAFTLTGEDSQFFKINTQGQLFSSAIFDYETKVTYTFQVQATNSVGSSSEIEIIVQIEDVPDIKATIEDVSISVSENLAIGTLIGKLKITDHGDSNISEIKVTGYRSNNFKLNLNGDINVLRYLDYESYNLYYLQYVAINEAGESELANLTVRIRNVIENSGSDYPKTESGIQTALDNTDYSFVLNQLLNNRDSYSGLDENTVNMNIAAAYVGSSGYTVFDITGAMSNGESNSFNTFVNDITKNNDAVTTINQLKEADTYYNNIVEVLDCNNTTALTQIEKDSCYNLGLVRMTSLTNSVKLLFGGDSDTVQKWANGVDVNSSDDLNGNGVLDASEASACAIVYANNPEDNCQNGTIYAYRGGVTFIKNGTDYTLTLIEVDVGNSTNGYQNFYQFISSNANNNTPILTSGVCDKNFNLISGVANGTTSFPCPTFDASGNIMGIKQSLENVANIQALFPDGDSTKATLESYLQNITGSTSGTIGLDNLSVYLRTH